MDLEEQRRGQDRFQSHDGGVETLQMADLKDAPFSSRGFEECTGGCEVGSDGLFDKDVEAGFHQAAADVAMSVGGRSDNGGVGMGSEVVQRVKHAALVGALGAGRAIGVGIQYSGQGNVRGLMNDAQVVSAKRAYADDSDPGGDPRGRGGHQNKPSMPSQKANEINTNARFLNKGIVPS